MKWAVVRVKSTGGDSARHKQGFASDGKIAPQAVTVRGIKRRGGRFRKTPAAVCRRYMVWRYAALMLPSFTWNRAACGSALRSSSAMCGWQVK